jgi:hypothetical protein
MVSIFEAAENTTQLQAKQVANRRGEIRSMIVGDMSQAGGNEFCRPPPYEG